MKWMSNIVLKMTIGYKKFQMFSIRVYCPSASWRAPNFSQRIFFVSLNGQPQVLLIFT